MCSSLARCKHRLSQLSEGLKPGMDEPEMIAIVDYGAGNLRSVTNAITKLGYQSRIITKPSECQVAVRCFPLLLFHMPQSSNKAVV